MRKRWIAVIVVAAVLLVAVVSAYAVGRSLFRMPTAQGVDSVIGEIGGERVLGVFSHPDDEQTVNGLFWRAKTHDDAYTAMITMTAGEAGTQIPVVARQSDLAVVRTAEALKNSFYLGVDDHEVWDYPDGGVPEVDEDELVDRLVEAMQRIEPDVVVGFWPASGATGHADHMETGRVTELAIARLAAAGGGAGGGGDVSGGDAAGGDAASGDAAGGDVDGGEAASGGAASGEAASGDVSGGDYTGPDFLVYTISPTKALETFGGEVGTFVVENQPDPHYAMSAEVGKKKEGWRIHASQEDYLQAAYGIPDWLAYTMWDQEFYYVRDLATDPIRVP